MRNPRLKIFVLALVAAVGATATVAVASPRRATDNRAAVQRAFDKTSNVASGSFSFTVKLAGGGVAGAGFAVSGTGAFDTKHKAATVSINLGALASVLGGATGGLAIPSTIDVVALNNTVYVHIPALAAKVSPGAEWLKFDSKSVQKSLPKSVNPGQVKTDPMQALKVLNGAISVHKVGSTTVRGSSTTHYVVSVDATKVVNGLVPKAADRASTLKSLRAANVKTVSLDVYVDSSGLVRRVSGGLKKVKVGQGTPAVSATLSVDLYDFGKPVSVSAPPASKTADGSKVLSQFAGALGRSGTGG
jgi:hypothetical protein